MKPWNRSVDAGSLVALRIGFGLLMSVAVLRYFLHGWIGAQFVEPRFFFTYQGFEWVAPGPSWLMHALFGGLFVLGLCIAVGWRLRLSAGLFCAGFTYVQLCDKSNYLNHYYLISLISLLLALAPLSGNPGRVALGWLLTFRVQVGVVYLFAGLAKIDADWLIRAEPLGGWLQAKASMPVIGSWLALPATAWLFSWVGMLFDLCIVPLLLWHRTRVLAFAAVVVFHVLTALLFPIGMFPWVMIVMAMVFLPPTWPRRWFAMKSSGHTAPISNGLACVLGIYMLVQIGLPAVRHLAPSANHWNEVGFRFAWKVMLIEKRGRVEYLVESDDLSQRILVDPGDELTGFQVSMMSGQPDMILEYGHHLSAVYGARWGQPAAVRVRSLVSLNGAAPRTLVQPSVNLAKIEPSTPLGLWVTQ